MSRILKKKKNQQAAKNSCRVPEYAYIMELRKLANDREKHEGHVDDEIDIVVSSI